MNRGDLRAAADLPAPQIHAPQIPAPQIPAPQIKAAQLRARFHLAALAPKALRGSHDRHRPAGRERERERQRVEQILAEVQPPRALLIELEVVVPAVARRKIPIAVAEIETRKT